MLETFNPYSIEGHYGMDLACRLLHERRPRDVAIYADDPEVTKAAVRRLGWVPGRILVQSRSHVEAVKSALDIDVYADQGSGRIDAALVAYSWSKHQKPPEASLLVLVSHNQHSYRLVTTRKRSGSTYRAARAWLQQTHQLTSSESLFAPGFLSLWGSSLLAGSRKSPWHFRLGQLAMDRLYARSALHRVGYVAVMVGERREAA